MKPLIYEVFCPSGSRKGCVTMNLDRTTVNKVSFCKSCKFCFIDQLIPKKQKGKAVGRLWAGRCR